MYTVSQCKLRICLTDPFKYSKDDGRKNIKLSQIALGMDTETLLKLWQLSVSWVSRVW